jgi:hypothetical protein
MKSLRYYIDILSEAEAPTSVPKVTNPYTGADAEKFARLSPADQAWYTKGGGKPDLNDPYIAARAPNKGKLTAPVATATPVAEPSAPAPAAPAAAPGASTGVNAQGQNVTMPDGTNPETGEKTVTTTGATPAPAAPAKKLLPKDPNVQSFQDEVKKLDPTAFPKFGADGRRGKEVNDAITKFPEIAKKYGLSGVAPTAPAPAAAPVAQSGKFAPPASSAPASTAQPVDAEALRTQRDAFGKAYVAMKNNPNTPPQALAHMEKQLTDVAAKMKAAGISESKTTSFASDEVSRIVSLVHYR